MPRRKLLVEEVIVGSVVALLLTAWLAPQLGPVVFLFICIGAGALVLGGRLRWARKGEPLTPRRRKPIDQELRWAIFERDNYQCLQCGSRSDLHLDHITPHSWGGSDEPENLQTLCRKCNIRKGARHAG